MFEKVNEEINELKSAIAVNDIGEIEEEFGDLLFAMANLGRHLNLDPEVALRKANQKFTRRFEAVENKLAALGKTPAESNLEEMDALWDQVKAKE